MKRTLLLILLSVSFARGQSPHTDPAAWVAGYSIDNVSTTVLLGTGFSMTAGVLNYVPTNVVYLSNTTVAQTAVVALLGGVRKVTITGVTGVLAGDRIVLTPTGTTPSGYALADVVATAANTLEVSFTAPALALGASFSIPCKVTAFR